MAKIRNQTIEAEVVRVTKVETTYEYKPIIGQILGFWKHISAQRLGEEIQLRVKANINEYDRVIVNGIEFVPKENE